MATKKNPAPTGDRRRGGKDAVGKGTVLTTKLAKAQRYEAQARRVWPHAIVLPVQDGGGPFAIVTFCGACIVSLHADLGRAQKVKRDLDWYGCAENSTRRCKVPYAPDSYDRHAIFDLATPFARIDGCELWREVE
jgi:hypothetical protein